MYPENLERIFAEPVNFTTRPTLRGHFGMAASTHWVATACAQSVLERGGNAYDAAVAGGFALHIVEPHLNGPGGDMTAIFSRGSDQEATVLMGQGPAPAGATVEHYQSEGLSMVPGSGGLAAAVPGAVDAWLLLLRDHGSWNLADVLSFAIDYAEHGHPAAERVVTMVETVKDLFTNHWRSSGDLWMKDGQVPRRGQIIRMARYAQTLRRLVAVSESAATREAGIDAARAEWGSGFVAEAIETFLAKPHRHSSGTDHAAVIRADDMAAYSATYEKATTIDFKGYTIAKTGPWGQGPVLLQALKILDGYPITDIDPSTSAGAHRILESLKLAFADRDAYYGDPDSGDTRSVPLETLLSDEYAQSRRALIGPTASCEFRPGVIDGYSPYVPDLRTVDDHDQTAAAGEPTVSVSGRTRGDTCHIDVVDRWGNMITATPSGGWLQSSPVIPELGFPIGTRLQMTWFDQSAPSALKPGRRPRTTLTPTLVMADGRAVAAFGSPGGDQQDQWQLLYLLRTLVGGYSPQEAIDAPAFHTTSMPGSFWPRTWTPAGAVVEDRLGEEIIDDLVARGHKVLCAGDWALGRLCAVTRDPETGFLEAAANPRGAQGYAAGR